MIDQLKCYVKDMPFVKRRRIWREVVDMARHEKYHSNMAEDYRRKKLELIREYEKLRG